MTNVETICALGILEAGVLWGASQIRGLTVSLQHTRSARTGVGSDFGKDAATSSF